MHNEMRRRNEEELAAVEEEEEVSYINSYMCARCKGSLVGLYRLISISVHCTQRTYAHVHTCVHICCSYNPVFKTADEDFNYFVQIRRRFSMNIGHLQKGARVLQ